MRSYQTIFRLALYTYPRGYRQEYSIEMLTLFNELIDDAGSAAARLQVFISALFEIVRWAPKENILQAETVFTQTPTFVKTSTLLSASFIAPFCFMMLYSLHTLHEHEARPALAGLISHTHILYALVLPDLALVLAAVTAGWALVKSEQYWQQNTWQMLRGAFHNCLSVFAGLGLLAIAVLC